MRCGNGFLSFLQSDFQIPLTLWPSGSSWQDLLLLLVNPIAGAFKLIYDKRNGFRSCINNFVNSIKELFINGWYAIVSFFAQTIHKLMHDRRHCKRHAIGLNRLF